MLITDRDKVKAIRDNGRSILAGGIATNAEGIKTAEEEAIFDSKKGDQYDLNYYQISDDLTNLNYTAQEVNTYLIAYSIGTFTASFKGFLERITEIRTIKAKPISTIVN